MILSSLATTESEPVIRAPVREQLDSHLRTPLQPSHGPCAPAGTPFPFVASDQRRWQSVLLGCVGVHELVCRGSESAIRCNRSSITSDGHYHEEQYLTLMLSLRKRVSESRAMRLDVVPSKKALMRRLDAATDSSYSKPYSRRPLMYSF